METRREIYEDAQVQVQGLAKISKSIKESTVDINREQARFLVDTYYQIQKMRTGTANQIRSITQNLDDQGETIPLAIEWVFQNMKNQEAQMKKIFQTFAESNPVGRWMLDIVGIGPVIASACLSYYDIDVVSHCNQFWSFSGLNDYNNPWLGKTGAADMVKEIYEELECKDDGVDFICKMDELGNKDKEFIKKKVKYLKNKNNFGGLKIIELIEEYYPDFIKMVTVAFDGYDDNRIADYLIRAFVDKNAVTDTVLSEVCCKSTRKLDSVIRGVKHSMPKAKVEAGIFAPKKSELTSYLAKPPYNINAKQLCFIIGDSFVKQSNKPNSVYGKLFKERNVYEKQMNENGMYEKQAREALAKKNFGKDTESYKWYSEGKLPPAHIYARCRRYAVRMFLSHLFEAMHLNKYGTDIHLPEIYPIAFLEHSDYIGPEVPYDRYIKYKKESKLNHR